MLDLLGYDLEYVFTPEAVDSFTDEAIARQFLTDRIADEEHEFAHLRDALQAQHRAEWRVASGAASQQTPVIRVRTVARPRERHDQQRSRSSSSSSSGDDSSGDPEPPGLAGRRSTDVEAVTA